MNTSHELQRTVVAEVMISPHLDRIYMMIMTNVNYQTCKALGSETLMRILRILFRNKSALHIIDRDAVE